MKGKQSEYAEAECSLSCLLAKPLLIKSFSKLSNARIWFIAMSMGNVLGAFIF